MGKIKTGTTYGYQVDAIRVEKDGTTHAPETFDFPTVHNLRDLVKACIATANASGLAQLLPIMPTAVKTVRKWSVDFDDIVLCPSFRYTTGPEIIPTIDGDNDSETE